MDNQTIYTILGIALVIIGILSGLVKKYIDQVLASMASCNQGIKTLSIDMIETQRKLESNIQATEKRALDRADSVARELNELKADLPMIYVLREDFLRCLNNVDNKITSIDNKIDKILSK